MPYQSWLERSRIYPASRGKLWLSGRWPVDGPCPRRVNAKSLDDLLKDKVKLGGDAAAAAGPVGRDTQASTTELANAEFLTYSRSQGLFAGVDLTGDEVHQNTADTDCILRQRHSVQGNSERPGSDAGGRSSFRSNGQ